MVKNLPSNTRDSGSIPGQGAKITCAVEQMSPCNSTREPVCHKPQSPHVLEPMQRNWREARVLQRRAHVPQLRPNLAIEDKY